MTGNLIPTPRTDKNGRTVVRHMKPQTGGGTVQASLPAVTLVPVHRTEKLRGEATRVLVSGIADTFGDIFGEVKRGEITDMVAAFSPQTLQSIVSRGDDATIMLNIYRGINSNNWDESIINDYVNLADVIARNNEVEDRGCDADLKALRYYRELCPQLPDGPYPDERRSQCEAIIETIRFMQEDPDVFVYKKMEDHNRVPFIADEGLRNLIVRSENREVAVRIIKERGILDAEHIASIMNTDSVALSEGAL